MQSKVQNWLKEHPTAEGKIYDLKIDGLKIYTTIDSRLQQYAQEAVNDNPGVFWLQVYLANGLGLIGNNEEAREQWRFVKARFPGLTIEGCLWWFKRSMTEEMAQRYVEGLLLAGVESENKIFP